MNNKILKFDYVIGNPPYNASGIVNEKSHKKYYKALGAGGKHGSLAFIMKALDVLKPNGRMVYIIPTNGMVLTNSIGFRKYVSRQASITKLWITNKDVFRNKITNKLEACIQGNTFIIQIDKKKSLDVNITTEYSNDCTFNTISNYSLYEDKYFPLLLSQETETVLNKCINSNGEKINNILQKGAMHNNIDNSKINESFSEKYNIKVMTKLNRGNNIKYGWTCEDEGKSRNYWKLTFSPICKVKEIMQYGGVSTGLIEPGISVQTNYSYLKFDNKYEAELIKRFLSHPLLVVSLIQLFDNAYINDSNLGILTYPTINADISVDDFDNFVWDFYKISTNDRLITTNIYDELYKTERNLMKKGRSA